MVNNKYYKSGMEMYKQIKGVLFNKKDGVTTVTWKDGTVTMVRLMDGDEWDERAAIDQCILKKMYGTNTHHKKELDKLIAKARFIGVAEDTIPQHIKILKKIFGGK